MREQGKVQVTVLLISLGWQHSKDALLGNRPQDAEHMSGVLVLVHSW